MSNNRIAVLSEDVANKIAAGEVIERPASIVKELVENSLDAGARRIVISARGGGKQFISVADDGGGMAPDEARLSLQRHATSKIRSAEDLHRLASFGFRGEALPSIAAVSRLRMVTALPEAAEGVEIRIEGGAERMKAPAAPRRGTLIEVSDLFFNTPARRKFLRADSTETGHIQDMVAQLALAHETVGFELEIDGRAVLNAPPAPALQRARQVLGSEIGNALIPVNARGEHFSLSGWIGKPAVARANRLGIRWFINRRWVRSAALTYALQEGYHGLLLHGKFPVAALFVDVDPERVDVNVHPTKQEVRLEDERAIKSFIMQAVAQALRGCGDLAPRIESPFSDRPHYAAPYASLSAAQSALREPGPAYPAAPAENETLGIELAGGRAGALSFTRVLGQIHNTYVIAETDDGLAIIDQHAAHERVMYESLLAQMRREEPESQALLLNEVLDVSARQREVLEENLPLLRRLGFDIEPFGENAFIVHSSPAAIAGEDPAAALQRFLDEKEGGLRGKLETQAETIAALIACKRRSVKGGDALNPSAVQTLLGRLAQCENPFSCPHGRPTIIRMPLGELERRFQRTG